MAVLTGNNSSDPCGHYNLRDNFTINGSMMAGFTEKFEGQCVHDKCPRPGTFECSIALTWSEEVIGRLCFTISISINARLFCIDILGRLFLSTLQAKKQILLQVTITDKALYKKKG